MNWATVAKQLVILLGAGLLVLGTFAPLLGVPIFKDRTFHDISPTGAWILVVCAVGSLILAILRKFQWIYIPAVLALILTGYTVLQVQEQKSQVESDLRHHVANVPGKSVVESIAAGSHLRHGFILMAVGGLILLAVPLLGPRLARAQRTDSPRS